MSAVFETYYPKDEKLRNEIQYFYFDHKPLNTEFECTCFPHYNNTLSIQNSHVYKAYIIWRLTCIIQGVAARYHRGNAASSDAKRFDRLSTIGF